MFGSISICYQLSSSNTLHTVSKFTFPKITSRLNFGIVRPDCVLFYSYCTRFGVDFNRLEIGGNIGAYIYIYIWLL
jgi:hypothetical protein